MLNAALKLGPQKAHKIGLYIRVSTEEQALNPEGSIKSQEQRLRSHIAFKNQWSNFGDVVNVFIDRAKSGKDTNRAELQKLLLAVQRKEVTLVMVTELSRLSRSIKDVCGIWELMRSSGCEFLSLREQFDTTTAAGEMVLYTIANIAQFERKQTSERISLNFQARAERGLFNGGSVPFGYKIDKDRKGHLLVDEENAKTVREAFKSFLIEGCLSKAGKALNERGFRYGKLRQGGGKTRLGHFTVDNLHDLLTNAAYVGVRQFTTRSGEVKKVRACWEAIIDENIFEKVQSLLKKNRFRLKSQSSKRYPYTLSGIIFCGSCGDTMSGKSAHGNGGKIPYYEHGWATRRQSCLNKKVFACNPHRLQAKKLEPWVWDNVLSILTDPQIAESIISEAHAIHQKQGHIAESDKLRQKICGVDEQVAALAEHLTQIPKGMSPAPIFTQMQRLEALKKSVKEELDKILCSGEITDIPAALKEYVKFCELVRSVILGEINEDLKSKIIKLFVHKVEVLPESYKLHLYVGRDHLRLIQNEKAKQTAKYSIDGSDQKEEGPGLASPGPSTIFYNFGSKRLTFGGSDRDRTDDLLHAMQALSQLSYRPNF